MGFAQSGFGEKFKMLLGLDLVFDIEGRGYVLGLFARPCIVGESR